MRKSKKKVIISITIIAFLICSISIVLAMIFLKKDNANLFHADYQTTAKTGYYTEILNTYERENIPSETKNEGSVQTYPTYGQTLSLTTEDKNKLINEASLLCATNTWISSNNTRGGSYDKMDENGFLYLSDNTPVLDENNNHRRLYKHSASVGLYLGDVSDNELAVCKKITLSNRSNSNSYSVTGLYAPAGEVIKLEMSKEDLDKVSSLTIHIGQCLYNGQANNIWAEKNFNRMPIILNTMIFNAQNATYNPQTDTYTCYVGSFLGGPIYIRSTTQKISITISNAVNYRHFILGKTTKEEFNELSKSSAPYFDLEVWDNGVLHSGPLQYVKNFSYDDLFKTAVLWEKISLVSNQVRGQGVVTLYDPFVAAGAAVAFPGRNSTNCPANWMSSSLNYESFISSGAWGTIHEYNHNFQGWGLPNGGEVTNNALSLASYVSFTKISASRTLSSSGEGGLSDWNRYTSASWALNQILNNYQNANQLAIYATLIHNIGAENFVKTTTSSGVTNYFKKVCEVSNYDMSYFFKDILNLSPDETTLNNIASQNLPKFIPVASVYQTGRSIIKNGEKQYIETVRPFVITYGEEFTIDLSAYTVNNGLYQSGSIFIPEGFSYRIKSISSPQNGTLKKQSENIYTYIPDNNQIKSGKIYVTLEITKNDNAFNVEDVDLVLEFEQSHENNKNILERTVYTYDSNIYSSAKEAFENNYSGYIQKKEENNINPVQNSNTDIWVPNPSNNAVMEVRGKLYIASSGDYRIALRGRHSCALYLSKDNVNFSYFAEVNHNTNKNDFWDDSSTFIDLKNLSSGTWIYFKEVLLVDYERAFIGLGMGKFELDGYTLNSDGVLVDENGNPISEENLNYTVNLNYANGYRNSYQFIASDFKSDYLFTKTFKYNHSENKNYFNKGTLVEFSGYTPWPNAGYSETLEELFDDDNDNYIHNNKGASFDITENNPFIITVDLNKKLLVNQMTIHGTSERQYQPKDFTLYGGTELNNLHEICKVSNAQKTGVDIIVNFEQQEIKYYKLVCTSTYASNNQEGRKYIAFKYITFSDNLTLNNGIQLAPESPQINYYGNWKITNNISSFGRIYEGQKGAYLTFNFTGTHFAILSLNTNAFSGYKIYIDNKLVETVSSSTKSNSTELSYLSKNLENKTHTVKIVCNNNSNIDSIVCW